MSFDEMSSERTVDPARLRRLRRNHHVVFLTVGLGALLWVGGGFISVLLPEAVGRVTSVVSSIGFVILAVMIVFGFSFGRSRCPRCEKPFYVAEGFRGHFQMINYLTKNCVHCGQSMNVEQAGGANSH
ncbi:MAG: hypothetical protein U1F77_00190 [Kiritimatiellia bacterium]